MFALSGYDALGADIAPAAVQLAEEINGGTGAKFNWELAVAAKKLGCPVILAGGLTPENAAEAARQVEPFALDVSSGVESAPGRKDVAKMRAFIQAVKSANRGV